MKRGIIILAAAPLLLSACEADPSLPSRPRAALLDADAKAQDNAAKREMEQVKPQAIPNGDSPSGGNSAAGPKLLPVITADSDGGPVEKLGDQIDNQVTELKDQINYRLAPLKADLASHHVPETNLPPDLYHGPLPHIPANPGTKPMAGTTAVPDCDWAIDNSWGEGLQLENYPHRPWPETTVTYHAGDVRNNLYYFFNLQEHLNVPQNNGAYYGDLTSTAYEIPWFFINAAALPYFMFIERPFSVRETDRSGVDPIYFGYLPRSGPVVATPAPGAMNIPGIPDLTTMPATMPATLPGVSLGAGLSVMPAGDK